MPEETMSYCKGCGANTVMLQEGFCSVCLQDLGPVMDNERYLTMDECVGYAYHVLGRLSPWKDLGYEARSQYYRYFMKWLRRHRDEEAGREEVHPQERTEPDTEVPGEE